MQKIILKKEWFNPLYFIILELMKQGVNEFYIYGGKGSAKTITIGQIISRLCLTNNEKAICFRKEGTTIKTTLKNSLQKSIDTSRLQNGFRTMEFQFRSVANAGEIVLKGIDNEQKVKGIEGYSYLYHDELDQFTKEDYQESINAFRGEVSKCYFGAWNPTDIESFIKTDIIDADKWVLAPENLQLPSKNSFVKINADRNKALIKTLYSDNYWMVGSPDGSYGYVDQKTIDRYERMADVDPHWYSVNVLGEWGVIKPTDPFFLNFDVNKHVKKGLEINKFLPIVLVFDFNVIYSCLSGQVSIQERYVRWLKDYYEDGLDLEDLCKLIINEYGRERHYIISGDASGNNSSLGNKGNAGCYDTIEKVFTSLKISHEFQVPRVNASHINSRTINNAIHKVEKNYFYDQIGCARVIADMSRLRASRDGGLNKQDAIKYNYGHLADCARYANDVICFELYESYDYVE